MGGEGGGGGEEEGVVGAEGAEEVAEEELDIVQECHWGGEVVEVVCFAQGFGGLK